MLHADLTCHVLAAEAFVRWQPCGGVAVGLLLVGRAVHGEQIVRIVRQLGARRLAELLRARLPGVAQRHDMVDLHRGGRLVAALEIDGLAGVGVVQRSGFHHAVVGEDLVFHIGQITVEDVVAGVAAVVVHILPRHAELGALVAGLGRAALHRERLEHLRRRLAGAGVVRRVGRRSGGRQHARHKAERQQDRSDSGGRTEPGRTVMHGNSFSSWSLRITSVPRYPSEGIVVSGHGVFRDGA